MPDRLTPDPVVLAALVERVRAAIGPDHDLDMRLFAHFWGWSYPIHGAAWIEFDNLLPDGGFTGSLDSAVSLVERELPGLKAGFQPCIGGSYRGHIIKIMDREALLMATARARTAPLAVLAAMFEKFAVDEIALLHQDEVGHA